jgi:hypothetical protein
MTLHRRTAVAFIIAALLLPWIHDIVSAQALERFSGTLSCTKSSFVPAAHREPVTAELTSNVLRYRHTVLDEDGTAGMGVETGEGPVARDGHVTLTGAWKSQAAGYAYEARYAGTVGPKGGELSGHQAWTIHGRRAERSCRMTLSRTARGLLR